MYSEPDTLAGGFPHSEICGSTIARISPQLIAACHVLHRLLAPRHPPNALISLETNSIARTQYQTAPKRSQSVQASSQHQTLLTTLLYATSTKSLIYLSMNMPTRTASQPAGQRSRSSRHTPDSTHHTASRTAPRPSSGGSSRQNRENGGDRVRTDDPLLAKQVLFQLSYAPALRALHPVSQANPTIRPKGISAQQSCNKNGPGRT